MLMPAKLFQKIGEASGCGEILKRAEDSKFIYIKKCYLSPSEKPATRRKKRKKQSHKATQSGKK